MHVTQDTFLKVQCEWGTMDFNSIKTFFCFFIFCPPLRSGEGKFPRKLVLQDGKERACWIYVTLIKLQLVSIQMHKRTAYGNLVGNDGI